MSVPSVPALYQQCQSVALNSNFNGLGLLDRSGKFSQQTWTVVKSFMDILKLSWSSRTSSEFFWISHNLPDVLAIAWVSEVFLSSWNLLWFPLKYSLFLFSWKYLFRISLKVSELPWVSSWNYLNYSEIHLTSNSLYIPAELINSSATFLKFPNFLEILEFQTYRMF